MFKLLGHRESGTALDSNVVNEAMPKIHVTGFWIIFMNVLEIVTHMNEESYALTAPPRSKVWSLPRSL